MLNFYIGESNRVSWRNMELAGEVVADAEVTCTLIDPDTDEGEEEIQEIELTLEDEETGSYVGTFPYSLELEENHVYYLDFIADIPEVARGRRRRKVVAAYHDE